MDGKWLLRAATALSAAATLAAASPAGAATCSPEQTVAALDQYCEGLPTPIGMAVPTDSGGAHSRPLSLVLPPAEVDRLRKAGPAAKALLLLPAVAPLTRAHVTPGERRRAAIGARRVVASGALDAKEGDVSSFASGLASSAPDLLGGAFRWGLVISSLGLTGMTWIRFRSRLRL